MIVITQFSGFILYPFAIQSVRLSFMPLFPRSYNGALILGIAILYLIFSAIPNSLYAESSNQTLPPVFQPDEIQHGFSTFDTLPVIPPATPKKSPPQGSRPNLKPPNDPDQPPGGLFYRMEFAKGFEEEEGIRRGHFIVPVDSTSLFPPDAQAVFLVFRVHQHYAPYQVFGRLYPEMVDGVDPSTLVDEDTMHLATEDDSGYLQFDPPADEWPVGSYRVEVFVGFEASQLNIMGTMRFSVGPRPTTP